MEKYYTMLTKAGENKVAHALKNGTKLSITHAILGDSFGVPYDPDINDTSIKNEVWRGAISKISVDTVNPSWVQVEIGVPSDVGGFTIREIGLLDSFGELIALGKYPATEKPSLESGTAKDLFIRMVLEVSGSQNVEIFMDPNVATATKEEVRLACEKLTLDISKKADIKINNRYEWRYNTLQDSLDLVLLP